MDSVEVEQQKQLHNLPAHLVSQQICTKLSPADLRSLHGTSKYCANVFKHHEAELVHTWLSRTLSRSAFRLETKDTQCSPTRLLLCLLRCNLITNGYMDAPMALFNQRATPPILLAGPLDPERWQQGTQTIHTPRGTLYGWHIARNGGSGWAWQPVKASRHPASSSGSKHCCANVGNTSKDCTMEITTATPHTWWLHARPLSPHDQGMLGWGMGSGTGRLLTAPDGEDFVVHVGEVVSSYRWCELHQEVNLVTRLQRYGMTAQAAFALLDAAPRLRFSVHVGAHTGCRAEYSVTVTLTNGDTRAPPLAGLSTNVQQLPENHWHHVGCVFEEYPVGVRGVHVVLQGRDGVFWSGHNGARFARCELSFVME